MNISHIPNQAWVYFFKDQTWNVLYIWKAKDLQKRVAQYFAPWSVWKQEMLGLAASVDFVIVQNESEALYLEDNLIKKHKPYYNNMLKWSNSYAYIKITNENFPQIFITRKKILDWSTYIWPKHNTIHLKKFFQYIRQVLQYRWCKNTQFKQGKLCSDYYFSLCKWRCVPAVIASNSEAILNKTISSPESSTILEYKKIISYITSFFRGDIHPIQKEILNQIDIAIASQNFERAAKLRDIYNNIDSLAESQTVVIDSDITGYIFKIKKIWNRLVYVLLYFYQWKLVDIIRHKFHTDESDLASIISAISNECGEFKLSPKDIDTGLENIVWIQKAIPKLSKSDLQHIDTLIEWFFDSYVISTSFEWENLNNELLSQIQSRYNLQNFPYHIECIDVSHFWWSWTSGALSCFLWWLAEKKYYRRYKINSTILQQDKVLQLDNETIKQWNNWNNSNDYASLKEIILRRFAKTDFLPNLFILDWWKWQLWIVREIYQSNPELQQIFQKTDFVALWKWEARKKSKIWQSGKKGKVGEKIYYFDAHMDIQSIDIIYDQSDKILIKARDEAHRFANSYREKQMSAPRKK